MAFEVLKKDLLGRIGRLRTRSGSFETPALLPVVNPRMLEVHPKELYSEFGYKAIITNAYLLKKNFKKEASEKDVHSFLDYKGIVMTDSGAYQILRYGGVEVEPEEIVQFQQTIKTDIGVILDIPTGWNVSRNYAEWTVRETFKRAKNAAANLPKEILWVAPIQGGSYLDLVKESAEKTGKLPFGIFALGSPTKVMEQYLFELLIEMIIAAKTSLPIDKPLHLFGAGHPHMFPFAVALGCDLFDSASYARYAKDDRYIMETGTVRLRNLNYLPCSCPICRSLTAEKVKVMGKREREIMLMKHNLYVCKAEIERIKQSISEGRLWELLELKARSHPSMFKAFKALGRYSKILEEGTPSYKQRGLLVFDYLSLNRPEILRHRIKLKSFKPSNDAKILLFLPQPESKPFHSSLQYKKAKLILKEAKIEIEKVHIIFYGMPFGIIPVEVDDIYPLSQFEFTNHYSSDMKRVLEQAISDYLNSRKYIQTLIHPDYNMLERRAYAKLKKKFRLIETTSEKDAWSCKALLELKETLRRIRA